MQHRDELLLKILDIKSHTYVLFDFRLFENMKIGSIHGFKAGIVINILINVFEVELNVREKLLHSFYSFFYIRVFHEITHVLGIVCLFLPFLLIWTKIMFLFYQKIPFIFFIDQPLFSLHSFFNMDRNKMSVFPTFKIFIFLELVKTPLKRRIYF